MSAQENPKPEGWTIDGAERLLRSLPGVVSVRMVAKPGGAVEEIHMLTNEDVTPKQTVRNVESALLARFDLSVDHRKISVAQARGRRPAHVEDAPPAPAAAAAESRPAEEGRIIKALPDPDAAPEERIVFRGLRVESERSSHVTMVVALEWRGERFEGESRGPDLPRTRLEAIAAATLAAIEQVARSADSGDTPSLTLDGVKSVEAFDRGYVLVAVHAVASRDAVSLAGSAAVDDSSDRAVIMATLQATDRWVRGRI